MDKPTRTNYIFVDYENVQELDLDLIAGKAVKVFLIIGQHRKSMGTNLSKQIHKYHDQVEYISSEGAGRNALDLVLSYYVGAQVRADPKGYFHILSKDKDYDALIKHLRANGILACRDEAFANIPALMSMGLLSLNERVKLVAGRFEKNTASRPKRKKTLLTTIHAFCRKELSDGDVQAIMDAMVAGKMIALSEKGEVTYNI